MESVLRHDTFQLEKPEITAEGFLKADAFLSRSGIFEYHTDKGLRRELRPEAEVFKADSLASLKMKPVTDGHPVADGEPVLVTPQNISGISKGHVGENITNVDGKVRAKILITDEGLIKKIQGGMTQLSCGYICDMDFVPGMHNAQKFDATQKNIVYNHVSVVPIGRAGKDIGIRMDEGTFVPPLEPKQKEVGTPRRIIRRTPGAINR